MKIDETNLQIIRHLKNGRKSFNKIAEELEITENTVRARVNKMIDEELLEITGLVNPEMVTGCQHIYIGVTLNTVDLVTKAEEFSKLKGVISSNVVTGRYDLIVHVLLHEDFDLLDFYTTEVSTIKDVRDVETFVVYKGFNARVPFVL